MKRGQVTALGMILCLLIGVFAGMLFPRGSLPWDNNWTETLPTLSPVPTATNTTTTSTATTTTSVATQTEEEVTPSLNSRDNAPLLETATTVLEALKGEDYATLSTYVHTDYGVTFTPYSSVDFDYDLTFTPQQIKNAEEDTTLYKWGFYDGSGSTISLTIADYFSQFVYDADYTQATQLAVDKILISGNSLENVTEAYPDCRFVEFSYPSRDPQYGGADWCSLKLVFAPGETDWYLIGIIHGQWTV